LEELYEEFQKFSRAEVLHFRKLGQKRKSTSENESTRPFKYNKSKEGHPSFDASHRQVHSIDSDGCRPLENWEKFSDLHDQKVRAGHMILEKITSKPEVVTQVKAKAGADFKTDLSIACSMRETLIIGQGIVPFS
jgi:hypothetical protein